MQMKRETRVKNKNSDNWQILQEEEMFSLGITKKWLESCTYLNTDTTWIEISVFYFCNETEKIFLFRHTMDLFLENNYKTN